MANSVPSRKRRRLWVAGAVFVLVLVPLILVAALPWYLGTPPARRWLLARANRALAPGGLDFGTIRFSWFGSTRITNFVLIDPQGDRVIAAPRARWDRNLRQILFDRPRYGTLLLDRAALDIERRADGTVDVYEAIKPILTKDPKLDLRVLVEHGRLRFRSAGAPEPVLADDTDFALHLAPAPRPLTWRLHLANGANSPRAASLAIEGQFDRWQDAPAGRQDLAVRVQGTKWPWTFAGPGLSASGTLLGDLAFERRSGAWTFSGEAGFGGVEVSGPRLEGDHLLLDQIQGTWDLAETVGHWTVRRLDLKSPLGSLQAKGSLPDSGRGESRIEGTLDLAALSRQLPRTLRLRAGVALDRGSAQVRLDARMKEGRQTWNAEARVSDLQARDREHSFTLRDPATLSARFTREENRLKFEQVGLETPFLKATGQGDLDRGFAWNGTLDLGGLQRQLHELIDLGRVELAGKGAVSGRYLHAGDSYEGTMTADLRDLRVAGLLPGKVRRDAIQIDLTLKGPATATGLPASWRTLRAGVKSGTEKAELRAEARSGAANLTFDAQAPLELGGRDLIARAQLAARWGERDVAIETLIVELMGPKEGGAEPSVRLAARGAFDRGKNELALTAVPGRNSGSGIVLTDDGLRVSGFGKAGALRVEGGFAGDLGPIARLVAADAGDWKGTWTAHATAQAGEDGLQIGARCAVRDLSPGGKPVGIALKALLRTDSDQVDFSELVLSGPYATLEASGRVTDLGGRREADLRGTLRPDWEAINTMLAARVEPGARVSGRARPFRLRGSLTGDWLKTLDGEVGFDLLGAEFYGMRLGPAPIVLRGRSGTLALDPIDTTMNTGRLHLEPTIAMGDAGAAVRLGPESSIRDAEINDAVSRRVLSFVAPVLDRATRVHGKVSVAIKEARFPMGGNVAAGAAMEGKITFDGVEFVPGPLADQLMGLMRIERRPLIRLNEPVDLTIADRRVQSRGMALPLGDITRIELKGWVDFDRNLALTASLPVTSAMVGNVAFLSNVVEGTKVSVPIRGTLEHPELDTDVLKLGLKDLGKTLLQRTAGAGAATLLDRMLRPRDPNAPPAPPRLTPQERRQQRMERKAERQLRREELPEPPSR